MRTDFWNGCYPSNWRGVIVDEAIVHPAKFSSKLIRRIYEHMVEEGWLKEGDIVIDPFGGVALGALDAQRLGLRWRGCELEQRFVDLGNANIAHWNERFSRMPKWNTDAILLQGDSRNLVQILRESGQGVVSSPPFGDSQQVDNRKNPSSAMSNFWQNRMGETTDGKEKGNLGNLRSSTEGFQAAISSPPFEGVTSDRPSSNIVESGTHEQLINQKGKYWELYNIQIKN